ncbi:MAG: hypothetical protein K8R68_06605, partial [Bacteroidales bacterium]|nr:hypothetical protein [Bacteroidales bacterium]
MDLSEFGTSNTVDASIAHVYSPQALCKNYIGPKVVIANYGLDNLTSLDISYQINEETPIIYAWEGDLAYLETELVGLEGSSFDLLPSNTLTITIENPNGEEDQFPGNNTEEIVMDQAVNVGSPIKLFLKLDENPEETTWEMVDSDGVVIYSGGPYS